jgi:hypothetical protein
MATVFAANQTHWQRAMRSRSTHRDGFALLNKKAPALASASIENEH